MLPLFISVNERGEVWRSMSRTVIVGSRKEVVVVMEGEGEEWLRAAATAASTTQARALVEVASWVWESASERVREEGGEGGGRRSLACWSIASRSATEGLVSGGRRSMV